MDILSSLIFLILTVTLYFISRQTINSIYAFFSLFIKNNKITFTLVSILYFPGTVIHEIGHFLMATVLFLKVQNIKLLPEFYNEHIKLGSVIFEKKDFIRGILVGIAPFLFAFFIFYAVSAFNFFPSDSFLNNIIFGYLIFTISSTMFSSKKDLIDLIYVIPFLLIIAGIVYFFDLKQTFNFKNDVIEVGFFNFLNTLNFYLFYSLIINLIILLSSKLIVKLAKK